MIPQQWASPCGNQCTNKFAALTQIPWRVFCKKGCDADGETWEECLGECNEICYKDPVLKDRQWSAYIDRSPGAAGYSEECFNACVAGCGYKVEHTYRAAHDFRAVEDLRLQEKDHLHCIKCKCVPQGPRNFGKLKLSWLPFGVNSDIVGQVRPNRPPRPPPVEKPPAAAAEPSLVASEPGAATSDVPCCSA